jgi:hypothetical protein
MTQALALARAFGVRVVLSDLGDWGSARLRSEYDPRDCVIRINTREARRLDEDDLAEFVALAIGHELYHHREHIGEIVVLPDRAQREIAADRYARKLLGRGV